jgi:hypothetical protein
MTSHELKKKKGKKRRKKRHPVQYKVQRIRMPPPCMKFPIFIIFGLMLSIMGLGLSLKWA